MKEEVKILVIFGFFVCFFISANSYFDYSDISARDKMKAEAFSVSTGNILPTEEKKTQTVEIKKSEIPESEKKLVVNHTDFKNDVISGENSDLFLNTEIEAHAAYVFDLKNNREIFGKNAEIKLPLASLTKLMTALIAYDYLSLDDTVEISEDDLITPNENDLKPGESWNLRDLKDIMLVSSSNSAASAISKKTESSLLKKGLNTEIETLMNNKAESLGMAKTHFNNSTGLDLNGSTAGAYGSAKDISMLLKYILENRPEIVSKTKNSLLTAADLEGNNYVFQNTNLSLGKVQGIIAGKTGFTNLSGGNLIVAVSGDKGDFIIAALGSSASGRFRDIEKIADVLYNTNIK